MEAEIFFIRLLYRKTPFGLVGRFPGVVAFSRKHGTWYDFPLDVLSLFLYSPREQTESQSTRLCTNSAILRLRLCFLSHTMNGIKKAALFLSGLDYTEADQLLSRLDGESARLIRREIMSLQHHNFSVEETQRLDEEFLYSAGWQPARSVQEHQFVTTKSMTYSPPKRPTVQQSPVKYGAEAFVPHVHSFDFMRDWSVSDVVSAIIDEHPQTIVVVLAHLPQRKMKSVLSALPTEQQREIKRRLDVYETPDEQFIDEIESALKMRYRSQRRPARCSVVLESFDDIETLSDSALAALFRSVDLTKTMLALIGADHALIARITRHFSPTEDHEMRKRLKRLNSIDEEDIAKARRDILEQYNATLS